MGPRRILVAVALLALNAVPADASSSQPPLRGKVVYASDGSLFVSSADGNNGWRLTDSAGDAEPAWSPDGTKVAFVRMTEHGTDLYVVGSNGNGEALVAEDVDLAFSWSPDGRFLAFSSATNNLGLSGRRSHIHVVDVVSGVDEQVTTGRRTDTQPQWSPDGHSIVFAGSPEPPFPSARRVAADLFSVELPSEAVTRMTRAKGSEFDAAFSPDGRTIAFASTRDNPEEDVPEIYTMREDGTNETRVTRRPKGHDVGPTWSKNGARLVYVTYSGDSEEGEGEVRVADLDKGVDRALTDRTDMMAWSPAWAPRGDWVAFVSSILNEDGSGSDTEITMVPARGGEPVFMTRGPRFEWGPDWH